MSIRAMGNDKPHVSQVGPVITRKLLESTLPWTVKLTFYDSEGNMLLEWSPAITLRRWDDSASLYFKPSDVVVETL